MQTLNAFFERRTLDCLETMKAVTPEDRHLGTYGRRTAVPVNRVREVRRRRVRVWR